jgi:hypothetical protein
VPAECGVNCISGPLSEVGAIAVDSGMLWIGEHIEGQSESRIDAFNGISPWSFVGPQLVPEGGTVGGIGNRIAVGKAGPEGQVYTVTNGTNDIAMYGATEGKLQALWNGSGTANKSFTLLAGNMVAKVRGMAVDRSTNPLTSGDVYAVTSKDAPAKPPSGASQTEIEQYEHELEERQKFDVVDVFPEPAGAEPKALTTINGTCATPETSCPGEEVPFVEPKGVVVSSKNGDVYVTDEGRVDVFRPEALHTYAFVRQINGPAGGDFERISEVAIDGGTGDVYVADSTASHGVVDQFNEEGVYSGRIVGTSAAHPFHEVVGVAVDGSTHDVFVAEHDVERAKSTVDVFGPNVLIPTVETLPATNVQSNRTADITATLNGEVDPVGEGEAQCQFAWGQGVGFGHVAACAAPVLSKMPVKVELSHLEPDTTYDFRLQASNKNGSNPGEDWQTKEFLSPGPGIHRVGVSDVASTSATFETAVDPNGAPTSVFIQYTTGSSTAGCGEGEGPCSVAPAHSERLGEGHGDVVVSRHVQDLTSGSVYHYRTVAISELEVEPGVKTPVVFFSADHTLVTQAAGKAEAGLLDDRRWRQVTPVNKHGAVIAHPGIAAVSMAAGAGSAMTYVLTRPTEAAVGGFAELTQVVSTRTESGAWNSQNISTAHSKPQGNTVGQGGEYKAFSPDMCRAVVEPPGPFTSLTPEVSPLDTERTPYVRHDCTCHDAPATCYEPLATTTPEVGDVPIGTKFGDEEEGSGERIRTIGAVNFVGASPDLGHVIVSSKVQLTPTPTPVGVRQLYEWSSASPPAERLVLISRNSAGQPATTGAVLGYGQPEREEIARNAVAANGSRVFWTEIGRGSFMYDVSSGRSLRLDTVQGGDGSGRIEPAFQGASADGKRAFFLDEQRLTPGAGAADGRPDLYACEITEQAGELKCELHDLTPANGEESAAVQGLTLGLSSDGSWIYFVADGVLGESAGKGATRGGCTSGESSPEGATCNLYVVHRGTAGWEPPHLVAVLSGDDFPDWGGTIVSANLTESTSSVSGTGAWLAFMSDRELTGYDNRDAVSARPNEEVFLYHATDGHMSCVSCERAGGRPHGVEYAQVREGFVGGTSTVWANGQWLAASLPGYVPYVQGKSVYQPRYLSDSGRMFFNTSDALVSGDVNGNQDVYEFEPPEVGSCSRTSSSFSPALEGCVGLVSSGRAAGESVFMDASESGDEVFFMTAERLVPSDVDTAVDIYDAQVCSSTAPCTPEVELPPACVTADACRAAPTPAPSVFGAPPSALFSGSGNITPTTPAAHKTAAQLRAEALKRALKKCRKLRKRGRRRTCEAHARKKYAPTKASAKARGHR